MVFVIVILCLRDDSPRQRKVEKFKIDDRNSVEMRDDYFRAGTVHR
jgi:hypothetical protein